MNAVAGSKDIPNHPAGRRSPPILRWGLSGPGPILAGPTIRPALPAFFCDQTNRADDHRLVHGLTHIVHSQGRHSHGSERLHLRAGSSCDPDPRFDVEAAGPLNRGELDLSAREKKRMAKGNKIRDSLRRHDPGESGSRQDIALGERPLLDQTKGLGSHGDHASGNGLPLGLVLVADIDHAGLAAPIDVAEPLHFSLAVVTCLTRYCRMMTYISSLILSFNFCSSFRFRSCSLVR